MSQSKENRNLRDRVLRSLQRAPGTAADLQQRLRLGRSEVSTALKFLKNTGQVTHDGDKTRPLWSALNAAQPVESDFVPVHAPDLRMELSAKFCGTPWQGLECVL